MGWVPSSSTGSECPAVAGVCGNSMSGGADLARPDAIEDNLHVTSCIGGLPATASTPRESRRWWWSHMFHLRGVQPYWDVYDPARASPTAGTAAGCAVILVMRLGCFALAPYLGFELCIFHRHLLVLLAEVGVLRQQRGYVLLHLVHLCL